jgi:hypothetical protein
MQANLFEAVADWMLAVIAVFAGLVVAGAILRALPMEPLCALLDAAARRHEANQARCAAAFVAAHGAQDIGELSREETRELFAICIMGSRLDAEMRALKRLIRRCQ